MLKKAKSIHLAHPLVLALAVRVNVVLMVRHHPRVPNLSGCFLNRANLLGANLSNTNLSGADLTYANLTYAKLVNARLLNVDLRYATLNMTNFYEAIISGTYLTRQQVGKRIIQETNDFACVKDRFAQAASVYRAFKNNFLSIGNYEDASWAYVKERQTRRKTHSIFRSRDNYQDEYSKLPKRGLKRILSTINFYMGHMLRYITDWFFEMSCQYGESPLQTISFSFVLIFLFSVFYYFAAVPSMNNYLECLNHSVKAFITETYLEKPDPIIQILTTIEGLFGLLTISLLMFSVGNRMKRS